MATPAGHQEGKSSSTEAARAPDESFVGVRAAQEGGAPVGALEVGSYPGL